MIGKTVEEAVEAALEQLGVAEKDAEIVVVEEPKSGMFGLRRSSARIRARVRPVQPRAKRPSHRPRTGTGTERGHRRQESPVRKPEKVASDEARPKTSRPQRGPRQTQGTGQNGSGSIRNKAGEDRGEDMGPIAETTGTTRRRPPPITRPGTWGSRPARERHGFVARDFEWRRSAEWIT